MSILNIRDGFILCLCAAVHLIYRYRQRRLLPFPPGPRRWPILKSMLSIPLTNVHGVYKDLGSKLGSRLIYLEALGQSILVINDITVAQDLFEKRSGLYSSRPGIPMLDDIVNNKTFFAFMPYGDEWRIHRRMFQQHFAEKHLARVQERSLEFIRKGFLTLLLTSPDEFHDHIRNCIGGLATSITYGLPVQRRHDPLVQFAEHTLERSTSIAAPGNYLVNIIPSLKYVPEWFPGAGGFHKAGREVRQTLDQLREEPYKAALDMMENGTAPMSFVSETLERHRSQPDFEYQALVTKQTAAMVFSAVSETTMSAFRSFVLGMLIRPDVQLKIQKEIDSVVGPDRLPEFSDIPRLQYLSIVMKETFRWNPVAPMGIAHTTSNDDVYEGYYIPKGCVVFANTYAMLHDDEVFPDPQEFRPERFIKNGHLHDDLPDPEIVATFGFGRRICPGSHIARSTLYMATASLLHLFDISPPLDDKGNPVQIIPQFKLASIVSEPLPFECKITPRAGRDVAGLLREHMGTDPI